MPWDLAQLKARLPFQDPQFVGPICDNVRACIVDRIQAALELAQYGPDGAQGRPVLPGFAADYNSERGFVEDVSPVLMVVPAETVLTAESGMIPQEHQIDIRPDIHHTLTLGSGGGEQAERATTELVIYIRAITYVLLSMQSGDFLANWPAWAQKPGGVIWNINEQVYDGLRRGDSAIKRSGRIRLEVKTVEA